jgi:hypothetical protein
VWVCEGREKKGSETVFYSTLFTRIDDILPTNNPISESGARAAGSGSGGRVSRLPSVNESGGRDGIKPASSSTPTGG